MLEEFDGFGDRLVQAAIIYSVCVMNRNTDSAANN